MHTLLIRILLALAFALCGESALAQSCTITMSNLSSANNYNPFSLASNDSAGIFSVACTRVKGQSSKFTSLFYVGVDNGLSYSGTSRRLKNGTYYLDYALYQNYAGCSTPWGSTAATVYTFNNANTAGNDVVTSPDPLTSGTSYCFRIAGGVNAAIPGVYSDTVQVGVADGNGTVIGTTAVTLSTTVVATCSVVSAPAGVTLNYTSFQGSDAQSAPSPFQMRCTNTTTYSLGFDTPVAGTNDRVQGLNYNLATNSSGGTGTGAAQNYNVTVTVPGNQGGTCTGPAGTACTGKVTRAVQITY